MHARESSEKDRGTSREDHDLDGRTSGSTGGISGETTPVTRRVVILGASNVARGIATVLGTARAMCPGSLEILAAYGHGRAYASASRILCRSLPPIETCGVWRALESGPPPEAAIVTDVGNDLVYGRSAAEVLTSVERCIERLIGLGLPRARLVLTRLPLAPIERITPLRFAIARRVLFPRRPLRLAEIVDRAREVDRGLAALARRFDLIAVEPQPSWYGFDAIHVRRRAWQDAWQRFLEPWRDFDAHGSNPLSLAARARLVAAAPQASRFLGVARSQAQPAWSLPGMTLSRF